MFLCITRLYDLLFLEMTLKLVILKGIQVANCMHVFAFYESVLSTSPSSSLPFIIYSIIRKIISFFM